MDIHVSAQVMHYDKSIWGDDAADFNPKRWIDSTGQLKNPPRNSCFLPWSGGPRICPGMKMSQVEFVATIATLFRHARSEVLSLTETETPVEAQARLLAVTDESISRLTLQVKNSEQVQLRWVCNDICTSTT
jgi:cytochrome P450